jgi:hypothetical protein
MRRTASLVVVLASLAAASPAAAQGGFAAGSGPGRPVAGPAFADGRMSWVEASDDLTARLVTGDVGTAPTVLATAPAPSRANYITATFGVSGTTALLWALFEGVGYKGVLDPVGLTALAGPPGAMHPIAGGAEVFYSNPMLVGDRVAVPVYGAPGATAIRFLDPATGAHSDVPARTTPWSAAGDVLAHLDADGRPMVTDWRQGKELYRPELPADWGTPTGVKVAPDGTALWSGQSSSRSDHPFLHGVSTPSAPAVRELPVPANATVLGRAGDRVLYGQPEGTGYGYAVGDFEGRVLARVPAGIASAPPGFDGHRIGFLTRPCAIPVVNVWDYENPGRPPPLPAPPPCHGAQLGGRPQARATELRVPLRCAADASGGCLTEVKATLRRSGRRPVTLDTETALAAGERRSAVLDADTRAGRRALAGPLRLTVVARAVRLAGERSVGRYRLGRRRAR